MIVKVTLGSWRFTFSMAPITRVTGVNSNLPSGEHIIMWDFDHVDYWQVHDSLLNVQLTYKLPTIFILQTSPKRGFHAWCFKRVSWEKLVEILAFTKHLDWNYFKYGIYRGKFTLRVSPKCGRKISLLNRLMSKEKEDVTIHDLRSWVEYETLSDSHVSKKLELTIPRGDRR